MEGENRSWAGSLLPAEYLFFQSVEFLRKERVQFCIQVSIIHSGEAHLPAILRVGYIGNGRLHELVVLGLCIPAGLLFLPQGKGIYRTKNIVEVIEGKLEQSR